MSINPLERITGTSKYFDNALKVEEIKAMLDSLSEKDNFEGMKHIMAVRRHNYTHDCVMDFFDQPASL
jgi:hypothetical protein